MSAMVPLPLTRRMPNLAHPSSEFRHSIDSALRILTALHIPSHRISIKAGGPGLPFRWIVGQEPKAGEPLDDHQTVTLTVAGLGFGHHLPAGLRDRGTESEPGTVDLLECVDDPLEKAAHWIREGALLFQVQQGDLAACVRWISLFGIDAQVWPQNRWVQLATFLPLVESMAGTENGIAFGLRLLLGLPLHSITSKAGSRKLLERQMSRLGSQASRLAINSIAGAYREDAAELVLALGPVSFSAYRDFQSRGHRAQLDQVLHLLMPCFRKYSLRWLVEDASRAPRLGTREANSILGVNSHLGSA